MNVDNRITHIIHIDIDEFIVLKKYNDIELSKEQQDAFDKNFMREITNDEIKSIKTSINNADKKSFSDKKKYEDLLTWLELVKNFNRARIEKQFAKLNLDFF